MPRTLNPVAHAVRRDAFLDAAERLIRTRGYDQMTVQDVLDELARRRAPSTTTSTRRRRCWRPSSSGWWTPRWPRSSRSSTTRTSPRAREARRLSSPAAGRWKTERSDLMLALMRALVLATRTTSCASRLRAGRADASRRSSRRIVRQGAAEGVFTPTLSRTTRPASSSPSSTARATPSAGSSSTARTAASRSRRSSASWPPTTEAIERILGPPAGSFVARRRPVPPRLVRLSDAPEERP